jgi:hypothetical protein
MKRRGLPSTERSEGDGGPEQRELEPDYQWLGKVEAVKRAA